MDMVLIFDRMGILIAQVRTSAARGYAIVTETSARFYLSVYDDKCNPFILNYGNWVVILNSDGLPTFVGMIDDIGFENGACVVSAFTPERLFFYRRGPKKLRLSGSAGEIFSQMIIYINSVEETVLCVGDIDSKNKPIEEILYQVSLSNNLARIVNASGECYRWRPEIDQGQLTIYCDWFRTAVLDTGLILQDGYNISGDHPLTQSAPINDVLAYGNGSDWNKRLTSTSIDSDSRGSYGLRQISVNYPTNNLDVLDSTADSILATVAQPKAFFPLSVLNVGDTYQKLLPGALATLTRLVGQGFSQNGTGFESDNIVVQSMEYDPADGYVAVSL